MSRSIAREIAFKALFQLDFNPAEQEEEAEANEKLAIETVISGGKKLSQQEIEYVEGTVKATRGNLLEIDEVITEHLRKGWTLKRLATVDRNVLRLAIYELKFDESKLPKGVIINEAVAIAKKYGTDSSGRFVNGILAAIAK